MSREELHSAAKIKEYIYNKLSQAGIKREDIRDDSELIEERLISSIVLVQIIAGIEDILDTIVLTDDIGIDEFTTIHKMMAVVSKYL